MVSPDRPIITVSIPPELFPAREPAEKIDSYSQRLAPAANIVVPHITKTLGKLPEFSRKQAETYPKLYGNGIPPLIYRGFSRLYQTDPLSAGDRHNRTLEQALKLIDEGGIEKKTNKVWFTGDLAEAFVYSKPENTNQVGVIIVSDDSGLDIRGDYYSDEGDNPRYGVSFKDIHVATVVYRVGLPITEDLAIYQRLATIL